MKEIMEEDVIGFDALYQSMCKCRKGVIWKDSVASYVLRGIEKTDNLSRQLKDGSYTPKPPVHFKITHPKPRDIASVAFRDRVYQRSLNDNIVYPLMTHSFIYDNYACQKGKGTDKARARLKEFLQKYYRKHGSDGWVIQIDIHGYYPNMKHEYIEELFRKKLPEWAFERVREILGNQYPGDTGYDPGSQLVQIAGISALDEFDHYCKERLHIRYYIRYMDDIQIIHQDREFLAECLEKIREKMTGYGFEFNPDKTGIFRIKKGIRFLGFDYWLTDSGKVIMTIDPKRVKAQRKKLYRLVKRSKAGLIPKENVDMSYAAWRNHAGKGNTWKLLQRMDRYYNQLWEGEPNGNQKENDGAVRPGNAGKRGSTGGDQQGEY